MQIEIEKNQFQEDQNERKRSLLERQKQELQTFDEESVRMGLNAMIINENYNSNDENNGSVISLVHTSNSNNSFTHTQL